MKNQLVLSLLVGILLRADAAEITNVLPTAVGKDKKVIISIDFNEKIMGSPTASKYALVSASDERVPCVDVRSINHRMRFIFKIAPANFSVFEKLVGDPSGYVISNDEEIVLETDTIGARELDALTEGKLLGIDEHDWKKYILDEYSNQYLFPQLFKIGTRLGIEDSTKTVYFLEMVHSDQWAPAGRWSFFWGLKGRWSTDKEDRLNYIQFYPLTLFHHDPVWQTAAFVGVETSYRGFGREGRGLFKGEFQFRLPYNPFDFTLGIPRVRVNPVMSFSIQGNAAWADRALPDSLKRSIDAAGEIRYDIPIARTYYLQANARGLYSTATKELQYRYDLALGYIADGTFRIMAQYKQGYQDVTYQFDKQLLLGFAIDVLNEAMGK